MYFQKRYIEENLSFVGTAGLMTIDLPQKGLLSCIEFRVLATSGAATDAPDNWLYDAIEKVEVIVNGSLVVKSLTGEQLLAMNQYQHCYATNRTEYSGNSEQQCIAFFINLGRWYHDLEYMLDLGRVNDPELRITYDFTKTAAAQLHGWDNGQAFKEAPKPKIWIIPHLLRDSDIIPAGYIKSSEVYRFTSGLGVSHNMTMPRGPVYCNLYLQSWYKNEGLASNVDHLELNINSDDVIPFRVDRVELRDDMMRAFGEFQFTETLYGTAGQEYPSPIECGKVWANPLSTTSPYGGEGYLWANNFTLGGFHAGGAASGALVWQLIFVGILPFSLAKIPHFDDRDPRTWINSAELGDLWLRVEEIAAAGEHATIKLLADEVVTKYLL